MFSSNKEARHVLITNCVSQNGGDAAILMAVIASVRAAWGDETEVTVVDDDPESASALFPDLRFVPRMDASYQERRLPKRLTSLQRRAFRFGVLAAAALSARGAGFLARVWLTREQSRALALRHRVDAVVSTGGTYLMERYAIGGRLLEFEVALALRRPLVLFTQSLGPYENPDVARAITRVLPRARLVLLRDERSREHLLAAGTAGKNLRVVADGVFGMDLRPRSGRAVSEVAISVRDWPYQEGAEETNRRYRTAIGELVTILVRQFNVTVTFISTCQGAPRYWLDDSAVAESIANELPSDVRQSVTVDRDFHRPSQLIELLRAFDLVIATRMHMAILSLVAGVPVFPIAYEFKTAELFERLGLGAWVCTFSDVALPEFQSDVLRFIAELPEISPGLWRAVEREHDSAAEAQELIRLALDRST